MAEAREPAAAVAYGVPGTPGIREQRPETGTHRIAAGFGSGLNPIRGGKNPMNLRGEIDTSLPFESVKEAVTRFGGSGPWVPLYKLGEAFNNLEDFDIKKVEEQAAELEKDLIVRELETLDVLEELGATKRIVEDLKQQLQKDALKCLATSEVKSCEPVGIPVIKEMNTENYGNSFDNHEEMLQISSSCSVSSPDLILMELKQAKLNLGKTINELEAIQSSVESLNEKMKKEKNFLERTREKLASKFAAVSAHEKAREQTRLSPPSPHAEFTFDNPANIMRNFNSDSEQHKRMVETRRSEVSNPLPVYEGHGFSVKIAEMKWFAAKKMEEAARAAEAIALAEIKALSCAERASSFSLLEPEKVAFALAPRSPLNSRAQIPEESTLKKVIDPKFQIDETNISKLTILKKMKEASEEVLHSKQVLTDALNRIETANRKQHAAEEALRRWIPVKGLKKQAVCNSINCNKCSQAGMCQHSSLQTTANNDPKPVLRPTISMRDVLSRKQVPEGYDTRKEMEEHTERQKVALSQMLRALREDLTVPPEAEKDESGQKQFVAQRKKFGFIQISFPMAKPNKKRA